MRALLKMTHRAMVLLLGMGGVLSLFLWANTWGQVLSFRGELDFEIGSGSSFSWHLDDSFSPFVNVNTSLIGLDAFFEFAGGTINASQYLGRTHIFVVLPWWLVSTFFLLYPAIYVIRRKRPAKEGKCVKCGYDLRGSKHRCAECGLQFENPSEHEQQDVSVER